MVTTSNVSTIQADNTIIKMIIIVAQLPRRTFGLVKDCYPL